jgi:outer membrane lipoprotein-sorting protein
MKRFLPFGLMTALILTLVCVGTPAGVSAQGPGLVSAVLSKMERNKRDLRSLRSGIAMEKYNAQIRDKDNYYGTVLYVPLAGRNANIRLEWQKPQHEILAVSNGNYSLYRPRLNTVYVGKTASGSKGAKGAQALEFMNMSGSQLKARFDIQGGSEENLGGGVSATHLTLTPKGSASFKYAEVWVDGSGMPIQSKIVEKNGDATTVRLLNIEKNVNLSDGEFKLQLDKGVQVIKG